MAIPKKGARRMVVDGVQYRWRVRGRYTHQQLIGDYWYLAVEHSETQSGQVMVIRLPQGHPQSIESKGVVPVLPSDVEKYIRMGRQAGWRPDQPGKQFLLSIPVNN